MVKKELKTKQKKTNWKNCQPNITTQIYKEKMTSCNIVSNIRQRTKKKNRQKNMYEMIIKIKNIEIQKTDIY